MLRIGISRYGNYPKEFWESILLKYVFNADLIVSTVIIGKEYDFIIFDGGEDVSPGLYKEDLHPKTCNNPERDLYELKIYNKYSGSKTKFVGICRGNQFLNVASGGTLIQHLPDYQLQQPYFHAVFVSPGTILYKYIEEKETCGYFLPYINVNSTHHQAIKSVGEKSIITMIDSVGVIEGFETLDDQIRAVQCHPEFVDFRHAQMILKYLFRFHETFY